MESLQQKRLIFCRQMECQFYLRNIYSDPAIVAFTMDHCILMVQGILHLMMVEMHHAAMESQSCRQSKIVNHIIIYLRNTEELMRQCLLVITTQVNNNCSHQYFPIWIPINVGHNVSNLTMITIRNSWRSYRNCKRSKPRKTHKEHVLFWMGRPQPLLTPLCTTMREILQFYYL